MIRKVIAEATFTLNSETASADTYANWCHVRLWSDKLLERKSNANGNGQTWEPFGYVSNEDIMLFSCNANEEQASRILAHVAKRAGRNCNVKGYGATLHRNATWLAPVVNPKTGRKLTAAPSIREGKPPRDKNVKARRWNKTEMKPTPAMLAAQAKQLARSKQLDAARRKKVVWRIDPREGIAY